jgi:hypothetical protein
MLKRFRALKIGLSLLLFSGFVFAQELQIRPVVLELMVGDIIQLEAVYVDSNETEHDTTAAWSVDPHQLATVNTKGLLTAKNEGEGIVTAILGELSDTVIISVEADSGYGKLPCVEIAQNDLEMFVGDSVQYTVIYIDTNEVITDTVGVWTMRPDSLGSIDSTGLFIAERPGECMIEVNMDTLNAWVFARIYPVVTPEDNEDYNGLVMLSRDTIVTLGEEVQFAVYYRAENGEPSKLADSSFTWSLDGMSVGTISQDGLLNTTAFGYAIVKAEIGDVGASALVIVQDSIADSTSINAITITRDSPNPQGYSVMRELTEGEIWTIGGLPHPMNVLNGGQIYFPLGCLTEDIRIHISLPKFAEVRGDSVGWGHEGVLAGVEFNVMVNDTIQEPYYFETPLIVGLVYKRGLLDKLGLDPASLSMFFATMDGDSVMFDTTGITGTTLDLVFNRIFSGVIHFSSLAIVGETSVTAIDDLVIPSNYMLEQNYPNPFNPVTTFRYTLPEAQNVSIAIYDITGRQVETLLNGYQQAGNYMLRWNASHYSSGVYFYRLNAGSFTSTKKMILMK